MERLRVWLKGKWVKPTNLQNGVGVVCNWSKTCEKLQKIIPAVPKFHKTQFYDLNIKFKLILQ